MKSNYELGNDLFYETAVKLLLIYYAYNYPYSSAYNFTKYSLYLFSLLFKVYLFFPIVVISCIDAANYNISTFLVTFFGFDCYVVLLLF